MKPKNCEGCSEEKRGYGYFEGVNRGKKITVVVGEPEKKYGAYGDVLNPYGQAGSVWVEVLRKIGRDWKDFNYQSAIRCVKTGQKWRGLKVMGECEGRHCGDGRWDWGKGGDGLILAVGKEVSEYLLDEKLDGKKSLGHWHGFVFKSDYGYVMPIDDLGMVKRGQFYLQHQLEVDVQKGLEFVEGKWNPIGERKKKKYVLDAGGNEIEFLLKELRDNPKKWLAYDLEGEGLETLDEDEKQFSDYQIYSIQFALEKDVAYTFRVGGSNWDGIREVFRTANKKVGHNVWLFDNPILVSQGIEICGGVIDTLWMFKHYYPGGVRKHLQTVASFAKFPFPWKHKVGEVNSIYPCVDVDALRYIYPWLRDKMKGKRHPESGWSLWDGYVRHYVKKMPIMDRASELGIPVDWGRWEKLNRWLGRVQVGYEKRVLEGVPREIRKVKRYKTSPREVQQAIKFVMKETGVGKSEAEDFVKVNAEKIGCGWDDEGWFKLLPFKLSNQQVMNYVEWRRKGCRTKGELDKWKLLVNRKTGKETTGKKALEKLAKRTEDPWLNLVIDSRSMGTTLNNMLVNWKPKGDGAVHTKWHFNPPTGQMGSKDPNILNMSKWNRLGQICRWMIYCPGDEWFIEFDKKSFHVGMLGFLAGDVEYWRASQLDIHSIFGVGVMGWWNVDWKLSDEEIRKKIKEFRKQGGYEFEQMRQNAFKPTTLGNQLGLGAKKLFEQNQPWVKSIDHAKELQRSLDRQFPRMAKWKKEVRLRAHRDKELMTWFGRIQRFYQVYTTEWKNGEMVRRFGVEHDKAPALEIQGNSFGVMDEDLLNLEKLGYCERYGLINMVHDNFSFRVKGSVRDKALRKIKEVLEMESGVLVKKEFPNGFKVGVDCSVGKNWRKAGKGNPNGMKEVEVV